MISWPLFSYMAAGEAESTTPLYVNSLMWPFHITWSATWHSIPCHIILKTPCQHHQSRDVSVKQWGFRQDHHILLEQASPPFLWDSARVSKMTKYCIHQREWAKGLRLAAMTVNWERRPAGEEASRYYNFFLATLTPEILAFFLLTL